MVAGGRRECRLGSLDGLGRNTGQHTHRALCTGASRHQQQQEHQHASTGSRQLTVLSAKESTDRSWYQRHAMSKLRGRDASVVGRLRCAEHDTSAAHSHSTFATWSWHALQAAAHLVTSTLVQ